MQESLVQIPMLRPAATRPRSTRGAAPGPLVLPADQPVFSVDGPDPDRVLLVGSGPAAGVGTASHRDALTGALARQLSLRSGRGATVESHGGVHLFLSDVPALMTAVPRTPFDAVVVTAGMMEAVDSVSNRTWERWLLAVMEMTQDRFGQDVVVVVAGMPAPSSSLLAGAGRRARSVDRRAAGLNRTSLLVTTRRPGWHFAQLRPSAHVNGQPTPDSYTEWAGLIAEVLGPALAARA